MMILLKKAKAYMIYTCKTLDMENECRDIFDALYMVSPRFEDAAKALVGNVLVKNNVKLK